MKTDFRSFTKKSFLPASLAVSLLFSGCGTFGDDSTDESKKYEVSSAIDAGEYDKAITMLEADCAGFTYEECQLNLGAAYLGKAGMDVVSLGRDLIIIDGNDSATDSQKEVQIMTTLFDIVFDSSMTAGTREYKKLLENNDSSVCNAADYVNLTSYQQQACIAINPILLQELMADETDTETMAVDMETIAQFKDVLNAVIPGITTSEIVTILNTDTSADSEKDVNGNGDLDAMEATDCAMNAYTNTAFDNSCTSDSSVSGTDLGTLGFSGINETIYGVDVAVVSSTMYENANFTRLVTEIETGVYTTVTTEGFCKTDLTVCVEGDSGCYPCPVVVDGELQTLGVAVADILNNDDLLTSIAIVSDSDTTKTSDEKVADLKTEMCGSADCTVTQDNLLDYMAR